MLRPTVLPAIIALFLASGPLMAQGLSGSVAETISARRGLMNQLGTLQTLIDARLAEPDYSPELYDLSQAAAASLDGFAMLLPTETNLLGTPVEGVETTAAAAIWDDLPAFQALLRDSAAAARTASEAGDATAFRASWDTVAASCTSCHQAYVVYDPFAGFN